MKKIFTLLPALPLVLALNLPLPAGAQAARAAASKSIVAVAQSANSNTQAQYGEEGVQLHLVLGNERVKSCLRLGSVLRFRQGRHMYGFSPVRVDGRRVTVRVYNLKSLEDAPAASQRGLKELEVPVNGTVSARLGLPLRINVAGVGGCKAPGGSCCVKCGSTFACDCSVQMSCGSCCSGECCPKTLAQ